VRECMCFARTAGGGGETRLGVVGELEEEEG
jgi:hypothetical protein